MPTTPEPDTWLGQFISGWTTVLSALRPRRALPPPPPLDSAPAYAPGSDLRIFVSVGSTRFDQLVEAALTPLLYESLDAAADREEEGDGNPRFRHVHILIQYGASDLPSILSAGACRPDGSLPFTLSGPPEGSLLHGQVKAEVSGPTRIDVTLFRFAPALDACICAADLVISHCGTCAAPQLNSLTLVLVYVAILAGADRQTQAQARCLKLSAHQQARRRTTATGSASSSP